MTGETLARPGRVHRTLTAPAAALLLLAGCASDNKIESAQPEEWSVSIPEITTPTTPSDLCSEPNVYLKPFSQSKKLKEDQDQILQYGQRNSIDELNDLEVFKLMGDLKTELGLNVTFPEKPSDDAFYKFGTIANNPEKQREALTASLSNLVEAVQVYSADVIKALNLKEIAFVDTIKKKPEFKDLEGLDEAGGLYDPDTNTIFIDVASYKGLFFSDTTNIVVHELSHAIDAQLLCSAEDRRIDHAFTQYNTQEYQGYDDEGHDIADKYIRPTPTREFVRGYGISNADEDRATIIEWTFNQRGLIQPGEPDYGSPLQKKQAELIRRLELLSPGTADFLKLKTILLRSNIGYHGVIKSENSDNELDEFMQSSLYPGELNSAADILEMAVKDGKPMEILVGGILEISNPYNDKPQLIANPILMRNEAGEINGVTWASKYSFNAHYLDRIKMRILFSGDKPSILSGIVSEIQDDQPYAQTQFLPQSLSIGGVTTEQIYSYTPNTKKLLSNPTNQL